MGNTNYYSYEYQKKAIKEGKISFELNLYFIGEDIYPLYEIMKNKKQKDNGEIFDYWNYYFSQGNYEEQLEEIGKKFKEKQELFIDNPNNIFKEVILIKMDKKDDNKIKKIFDTFASEADVYCPFILFLFNKQITPNKDENIVFDFEEYLISPLKVLTFNFQKYDDEETMELYKKLFRICSYYNELGDQFILWPKNKDEPPYPYDLINSNFSSYINIFCLGKTGCGKSTFLNKFFNEKRSKQGGTGKSTTTKIVRFGIDNFPIRIYDIPGFESKETIDIVNKKLTETTKEMYNDNDRIHLILYFINYNDETIFYGMENTIIDTLKKNNNEVKIIFVLTHCPVNPYDKEVLKNKKKKKALNEKVNKFINVVSAIFGKTYSVEQNYFKKDSIFQENLFLVNLVQDDLNDKEEFGFEKIIESIYNIITEGNSIENLKIVERILVDSIISKKKITPEMDKNIEILLKKSYLINQTTFALQKEKIIIEAQKLYDNMFSIGKTILACCPIIRDVKLGIIKYQKKKFKENLKRIFGFTLKNDTFAEEEMTNLSNINNNYYKNKEIEKENKEKEDVVNEIRKGYHEKEVNSTWIVANEIAGEISYFCMFGGPIGIAVGGAGIIGTSYISYSQFKKDCTEYFEQYKKYYEENKYYSLLNFIISTQRGIEFFKNYLEELNNGKNITDLQGAPIVQGINDTIKGELKSMIDNNQDIYNQIPVLNE